jgi:hypothetical protein
MTVGDLGSTGAARGTAAPQYVQSALRADSAAPHFEQEFV